MEGIQRFRQILWSERPDVFGSRMWWTLFDALIDRLQSSVTHVFPEPGSTGLIVM